MMVFSDFDGTITQVDVTDQILTQLAHPSWREVEQAWVRGLIGSRECLERQVALVETSRRDLNSLIDSVPVDPHFKEFYRFTQRHKVPLYVVSDGFDHVIRRALKNAGVQELVRDGSRYFASALRFEGRRLRVSFPRSAPPCVHGCATCKARIMRRLGRGHHPLIFIGDGLSDRFAVEECDVIFAKRQLLAYCRAHGFTCHPFETFEDVQTRLAGMLRLGDLIPRGEGTSPKSRIESRRPRVDVTASNST